MPDKSWTEYFITCPEGCAEIVSGALFEIGCEGITEEPGGLRAYFPADVPESAVDAALSGMEGVSYTTALVEDQDWYAGWKAGFGPFSAGELFVCPPWKLDEFKHGPGQKLLVMDPGQAFGTGDHDSTLMVIGHLREWSDSQGNLEKKRILDLGTGTGILSIAAYIFGARDLTAVDIEPQAVRSAANNFELNGIAGKVRLIECGISVAGSGYDLIMANIFQEVLVAAMPGIANALNPGGTVMLSGLLTGQEDSVVSAAEAEGLKLAKKVVSNGWVSLLLTS